MRHLTNNIAVIIISRTLAITLMAITISFLPPMLLRGTRPVGVTFGNGCHGVTPEWVTINSNTPRAGCTPGASNRYCIPSVVFCLRAMFDPTKYMTPFFKSSWVKCQTSRSRIDLGSLVLDVLIILLILPNFGDVRR